jgi:subtilase family serine protease
MKKKSSMSITHDWLNQLVWVNCNNRIRRRRWSAVSAVVTTILCGYAPTALAQQSFVPPTTITLPPSSIANPGDAGVAAHTFLQVLASSANFTVTPENVGPPFPGLFYQTPASLACVYGLQPAATGCNPNIVSLNPSGGSRAIGIVDAFDDPNAFADLQFYSKQFGLIPITTSSFQVVFAPKGAFPPGVCQSGAATRPKSSLGTGWDIEESLDIEISHAMAPGATIYLVEAQTNSLLDLFCAVSVASNLVSDAGGGEISMSFGSGEFSIESLADPVFTTPNVVYFASAGDSPGVSYPSASPNVVSVGGTSLSFNPATGSFIGENTWQDTGGGPSLYESRPSYQDRSVAQIVGSQRGTPDISSDANPATGVWVWDSLGAPPGGFWYVIGGTSVSSPTWAGIVNAAGGFSASSQAELGKLYSDPTADFTGIKQGNCGPYMSVQAGGSWDFCSGRGSPNGYQGK